MSTPTPENGTCRTVAAADREILRALGARKAEISALGVQQERIRLWTRLNDLASVRPMVWLFEVPWHEMDVAGELELRCVSPFCRDIERSLRRELYQWDHMPGDMVVAPVIGVPPPLRDTGFGLSEEVDVVRTDAASPVVSRHFHVQIRDERDAEKIRMPEVALDRAAWDRRHALLSEVFDGVIAVTRAGIKETTIAPWDFLVRLTGVEEVLMDMHARPGYVHRLIDRLTAAHLHRLAQYEALNLLAANNDTALGGGYQYTDDLPGPGHDPRRTRARDIWGRTMSQIFSAVSPAMHEEFALRYECRWLGRFGLTYYGCCEPLHKKVGILRANVPNLRKISMSPWIDLDEAAEEVGGDYVFSLKPSPAVLAEDAWNPDRVRRDLQRTLARLRGMHVEIVMKDISTVRYQPQRLWEWARIASEAAADAAA